MEGQDKTRPLRRRYDYTAHGPIFVSDNNDRDRIEDAREKLTNMVKKEEMRDAMLLVFADQQAMPNALTAKDIKEKMGLHIMRNHQSFSQWV